MLTFQEVAELVNRNLEDTLDPALFYVKREPRELSVLYTVTKGGEFLGRYRVSARPDGGANYGPIQGDGPLWNLISESMVTWTLLRAEGKLTEAMEKRYYERQEHYKKQIEAAETEQVGISGSEETTETTSQFSEKTKALNRLAVLWVEHNQGRLSRSEDMSWFLGERVAGVGLTYVTTNEFKKHLRKAYEAGIIGKDEKTRHFIPK